MLLLVKEEGECGWESRLMEKSLDIQLLPSTIATSITTLNDNSVSKRQIDLISGEFKSRNLGLTINGGIIRCFEIQKLINSGDLMQK